jgi:hypothetical protein
MIVKTTIGLITFYIIEALTPFLIYVQDMDKLEVYFCNTTNELVLSQKLGLDVTILVTRKWGYLWFFLGSHKAGMFFIENEL